VQTDLAFVDILEVCEVKVDQTQTNEVALSLGQLPKY
jgi:hypothetical protein